MLRREFRQLNILQDRADRLREVNLRRCRQQCFLIWVRKKSSVLAWRKRFSDRLGRNMISDLGIEVGMQSDRKPRVWRNVFEGFEVCHCSCTCLGYSAVVGRAAQNCLYSR